MLAYRSGTRLEVEGQREFRGAERNSFVLGRAEECVGADILLLFMASINLAEMVRLEARKQCIQESKSVDR